MKKIKADIFIPTSNRIDALTVCLESLSKQTRKDFNLIVVGLKEDQKITDLLSKYKSMERSYVIQKRPGLINAANEAIKIAKNDIFIRIDDDIEADINWFKEICNTFDSNKNIGGVTGPTIMSKKGLGSRDLTKIITDFKNSNNFIFKFVHHLYANYLYEGKLYDVSTFLSSGVFTLGSNFINCLEIKENRPVNNLEACNWSARTELLKKIGGFDVVFLKGLGDYHEADAALKIKELGYLLIFNPLAKLKHNVEVGTVAKSRPATYYRIQNFIIFYFRHFKINSIDTFIKFSLNLILQNIYYLYKFAVTRDFQQLGAIPGTFVGFGKVFLNKLRIK